MWQSLTACRNIVKDSSHWQPAGIQQKDGRRWQPVEIQQNDGSH
jgi:hypothetical protein